MHTILPRAFRLTDLVLGVAGIFVLLLFVPQRASDPTRSQIHIPNGKPIVVDGIESTGEWSDSNVASIEVAPDWIVQIRFKHDAQNLYFAFENVKHGDERLFPEILLDTQNQKTSVWVEGEWWLHISNNLCEGNGLPNVYQKNGAFQCAHQKPGWDGNNPPDVGSQIIEARVSFAKLGLRSAPGTMGIAFDMTNATGDRTQKWFFWPSVAKLESPKTWGTAVLE